MREVAIIGVGMSKFGELWERSFRSLITEAGLAAVKDAGIGGDDIDALYVGSMSAGRFIGQEHIGALVADEAGLTPAHIPATRVEAADASGGVALRQGYLAVASGAHDVVVVGGVEKMTDVGDVEQTNILAASADREWEAFFGATVPSLYAMMATRHMHDYGTTREQLARVSVKNHENGALNPNAAYPFTVKLDSVLTSPLVASPLRVLDMAASVDGAAAVVLCAADRVPSFTGKPVKILASGQASDSLALHDRASFTSLGATQRAAALAYRQAGITARDVNLAEVHDAFTISEVMAVEDLGFVEKGQGGFAVEKGVTTRAGSVPVNTSGGLKARGHPLGATGIAQAIEITQQLRGNAGARQVRNARIGLAHNVGGSGATATVHLLGGWE
ncbi:MAG TPA: thiolase domain-containing protein [Candidatus Thermoplasmatota archaeon]|nr:thiolase domain-containing protein [Candidatus Thermoplasmatota archaeon]